MLLLKQTVEAASAVQTHINEKACRKIEGLNTTILKYNV